MTTLYVLAMITSTAGGQPLVINLRTHATEAACVAERDQLIAADREARKTTPRLASDVDYICVDKSY